MQGGHVERGMGEDILKNGFGSAAVASAYGVEALF